MIAFSNPDTTTTAVARRTSDPLPQGRSSRTHAT
jgi:hypothetical protein